MKSFEIWNISDQEIKDVCNSVFAVFRDDPFFKDEIHYWDYRVEILLLKEEIKGAATDRDEVRNAVAKALSVSENTTPHEAIEFFSTEVKTLSDRITQLSNTGENARDLYIEKRHQVKFCLAYFRYLEKHPEAKSAGVDQSEKNKKNYIARLRESGLITQSKHMKSSNSSNSNYYYFPTEKFTPENIKECLGMSGEIRWTAIASFKQIIPVPYSYEEENYKPVPMDSKQLRRAATDRARKKKAKSK